MVTLRSIWLQGGGGWLKGLPRELHIAGQFDFGEFKLQMLGLWASSQVQQFCENTSLGIPGMAGMVVLRRIFQQA